MDKQGVAIGTLREVFAKSMTVGDSVKLSIMDVITEEGILLEMVNIVDFATTIALFSNCVIA